MSPSRSAAIVRHELRLHRQQVANWSQLLFIPMIMMIFLKGVSRFELVDQGYRGANGSEQVVPGMTVMFAFFMCGSVGFAFFLEHGWGTWERLRASAATPAEIIAGKALSPWVMVMIQQALLFGFGVVFLGLRVRGSWLALLLVSAAFGLPLIGYGMLLAALCKRSQQLNMISSLMTMVFAGLGGAIFAPSNLPAWAQGLGALTPTYWTMQGYRAVILDGGGVVDVLTPVAALVAMGGVLFAIGVARFRFEETKIVVG